MNNSSQVKESIYYVSGISCASCAIFIEKRLLDLDGVRAVEVSLDSGEVLVEYDGDKYSAEFINNFFKDSQYVFFEWSEMPETNFNKKDFFKIFAGVFFVVLFFWGLNKSGLFSFLNVNAASSLPMFFVFGLIAGISSCAALLGGIVLSMSKQWSELYSQNDSLINKLQPHFMFNAGRVISYAFFGFVLGALGEKLNLSFKYGPFFVVGVSILMIIATFQMFGLKLFSGFANLTPKFIVRFVADESNFKSRFAPFLMGASTFFLPCGFTLTVQGLSLVSGSPIRGSLIMLLFALGTSLTLLLISLSSVSFSTKPHLYEKFLKIAGIIVLFFAVYNINAQLSVLGFYNLNNIDLIGTKNKENLILIENEKQVIKMDASDQGYSPDYFKIKVGVPVRWEIYDKGTSGCTNAIIAKDFFSGQISLTPSQTSIKEFIPEKVGKFRFSCWMGMVSGTIEVVN